MSDKEKREAPKREKIREDKIKKYDEGKVEKRQKKDDEHLGPRKK